MKIEDRVSPYDYSFDPEGPSTAARISRMVGQGQRVLELGCGYGVISRQLSQAQGCTVTGVEIDPVSGARALAGCPDRIPEFFLEGTAPVKTCPKRSRDTGDGFFRRLFGSYVSWAKM